LFPTSDGGALPRRRYELNELALAPKQSAARRNDHGAGAGFGLVVALWMATLEARWRNVFLALAIVALALPPFLVTNCWISLLGETGVLRKWLPFGIYSLGGTIWILSLLLWPITLFAALAAWRRLEAAQLECEPAMTGWALLRWLLVPVAKVNSHWRPC